MRAKIVFAVVAISLSSGANAEERSHVGNFGLLEHCFSFARSTTQSFGLAKQVSNGREIVPDALWLEVEEMTADLELIYVAAGPRVVENFQLDPGSDWPNEFLSLATKCAVDATDCNYDAMWSKFHTYAQRLRTDCTADYRGEL